MPDNRRIPVVMIFPSGRSTTGWYEPDGKFTEDRKAGPVHTRWDWERDWARWAQAHADQRLGAQRRAAGDSELTHCQNCGKGEPAVCEDCLPPIRHDRILAGILRILDDAADRGPFTLLNAVNLARNSLRSVLGAEILREADRFTSAPLPEPEAMAFLRRIESGEVQLELVAGPTAEPGIKFQHTIARYKTSDGWEMAVFNDAGEWDYVEWITAPDGRCWSYEKAAEPGDEETEVQAYQPPKDVVENAYHWNKMEGC
jgi:hypothetical protein